MYLNAASLWGEASFCNWTTNLSVSVGGRQLDGKARTDDIAILIVAIAGDDGTAMGLYNLTRDRQSETGMGPESRPFGALGVEAVKHRLQIVVRNAWPLVIDMNLETGPPVMLAAPDRYQHFAVRRRKGQGIVEQISKLEFFCTATPGNAGSSLRTDRAHDI